GGGGHLSDRAFRAVRWVLLGATALAAVAAAVIAATHDRSIQSTDARYRCPMHPEVLARAPGACPICGMALERATGDTDKFVAFATQKKDERAGQYTVREVVFTDNIRAPAW